MLSLDNQFLILYTGEATKSFSVALLQANVNFQKNGLTVKNKKKSKKKYNPNLQKSKKNQKNPQKKSL